MKITTAICGGEGHDLMSARTVARSRRFKYTEPSAADELAAGRPDLVVKSRTYRLNSTLQALASSMTAPFPKLPDPPYYSVIFSSLRAPGDSGYAHMVERMVQLAAQQPGYLGVESVRGADGFGITVSYWDSLEAIASWRSHPEHQIAQDGGKSLWYMHYELRIARVERAYAKPAPGQ